MADKTKIEWADATVNAINGCSLASPGCINCYAMSQAHRFEVRRGLTEKTKGGMVWTGEVRFNEKAMLQPLSWKNPKRIFWNAHGDTFHEKVPDEWIDRMFAVMALTPQHQHMVLTKRSLRMREYVNSRISLAGNIGGSAVAIALEHGTEVSGNVATRYPRKAAEVRDDVIDRVRNILPNIWLGVSVEDQKRADERIPDLLATPAAKRFLSCEPLLGPVDLDYVLSPFDEHSGFAGLYNPLTGSWWPCVGDPDEEFRNRQEGLAKIDLVIIGGEQAHDFRDNGFEANARRLIEQCKASGTAVFMKQMCGKPGKLPPIPHDMLIREGL